MIYIYYIMYRDYVIMCVLTVGDDELAMGDNNNMLSEAAGDGHVWECLGNSHRWASQVWFTGTCLFFLGTTGKQT